MSHQWLPRLYDQVSAHFCNIILCSPFLHLELRLSGFPSVPWTYLTLQGPEKKSLPQGIFPNHAQRSLIHLSLAQPTIYIFHSIDHNCWWLVLNLLPHSSVGKESACNEGEMGSNPGLGRSPGERKGYPLQYSGLKNSMDCSMGLQRVGHDWGTFTFTH